MVRNLIRNQAPGNRLRVRIPCPPLQQQCFLGASCLNGSPKCQRGPTAMVIRRVNEGAPELSLS
jgi:hypothetical protein